MRHIHLPRTGGIEFECKIPYLVIVSPQRCKISMECSFHFFSGLPWSVYGWFYSNVRGNDADTFISMDMQSFIISADLVSALLDNSMEELAKAADPPTFLGIFF